MTKKELAEINKEIERLQKFLTSLRLYEEQLSAIRKLLEISAKLAKRSLPHDMFKEHSETLNVVIRDLQGLAYETRSYEKSLEEERAVLEGRKNGAISNL